MSSKESLRRFLPRNAAQHRIWGGPLRGLSLVTSWREHPAAILGRTKGHLLRWLAAKVESGETWLDIGTRSGYTALAISHLVGATGRVFAFAPAAHTAGCVAGTRDANRLSQLIVVPIGLANPASMALTDLPPGCSLVDSPTSAGDSRNLLIARLDWLWPHINNGNERIHGVKINIRGLESAVLEGMANLLRRQMPKLVVEFHKGVDRGEVLKLLESCGYSKDPEPLEPLAEGFSSYGGDERNYAFAARVGMAA